MKNVTKKVLLLVLVILAMVSGEIFATSEFKEINKSAEFEKWENLKDEERTKADTYNYSGVILGKR